MADDTPSTPQADTPGSGMPQVRVAVTRSAGSDGAVVVFVDTEFEPDGSDGGPGLRVLLNDAEVYVGTTYQLHAGPARSGDHDGGHATAGEFVVSAEVAGMSELGSPVGTYHGIVRARCSACGHTTSDVTDLEMWNDLGAACMSCDVAEGENTITWWLVDGTVTTTVVVDGRTQVTVLVAGENPPQ